jgi:hypothetical protein
MGGQQSEPPRILLRRGLGRRGRDVECVETYQDGILPLAGRAQGWLDSGDEVVGGGTGVALLCG